MAIQFNYPGFDTIKKYYDLNVYDNSYIKYFTDNYALSKEQYEEITGEPYPEDEETQA